jgi:hypothetical protein
MWSVKKNHTSELENKTWAEYQTKFTVNNVKLKINVW